MAAGFRSALPALGYSAPPRSYGYRGFLAFWSGGACIGPAVEEEEEQAGGGFPQRIGSTGQRRRRPDYEPQEYRSRPTTANDAAEQADLADQAANVAGLESLARKLIAAREAASPMTARGDYDVARIVAAAQLQNVARLSPETEDEIAALMFAAIMMMDD
jgi:hypothetical protein